MKGSIILFTLLLFMGCNEDVGIDAEETIYAEQGILGCWQHDIENQTADLEGSYLMGRCGNLGFSGGFGYKYSFILKEDGKGSELLIGIADNHTYTDITWSYKNDFLLIGSVEYQIVEMTDDRLLIKRVQ